MVSASALIIGDEILSGKIQDKNSYVLAKVLFERGVKLSRLEVISDDIDEIGRCLKRMSVTSDYVFTSGGIGPTHDDKTYEAIAKAFDRKLVYHEQSLKRFTEHLSARTPSVSLNEARKKMVLLPDPCEILWTPGLWVPLVIVENVYVLPGVPELFEHMLTANKMHFKGPPIARILVYTAMPEGDIAFDLERIQNAYPQVAIGSYPRQDMIDHKVMVSFEGRDAIAVQQAAEEAKEAIGGFILD